MTSSKFDLPKVDSNLLDKMVKAVVKAVNPTQVILFGSQAKGNAQSDSDIDFLVVEAEGFGPGRSRHQEAVRVWRTLAKFGVPTDVLIYSAEEVKEWSQSPNHVISKVLKEGQVLYERPEASQSITDNCSTRPKSAQRNDGC